MRYLRTNTATRITVGPFLDKTDGITPEVAITVTAEKLTLMVDTAGVPTLILDVAPTASGGANDMVHVTGDDSGFYDLELAAANVNYLGPAMLSLNDVATHCPVFHEFMILPAMIYDAIVLGTDVLDASVTQLLGTAWLTPAVAGTPDVNAKQLAGQTITAAAGVTFPTSVASPTNITAGTVTTATNLTTNNDKTGYGLSAAAVQAIWDALTSALTTAGSIGKKLADWVIGTSQTGDSFARLGAPAGASVSADVAAVKVDTAAILVDTGTTLDARIPAALTANGNMKASLVEILTTALTETAGQIAAAFKQFFNIAAPAATMDHGILVDTTTNLTTNNDKTGYTLSATGMDNLLTRAMTESYSADGGTKTVAQALYEMIALLSEFSVSGTTVTVKKLDGSTTAMTLTLNDATSPSSLTRAT